MRFSSHWSLHPLGVKAGRIYCDFAVGAGSDARKSRCEVRVVSSAGVECGAFSGTHGLTSGGPTRCCCSQIFACGSEDQRSLNPHHDDGQCRIMIT